MCSMVVVFMWMLLMILQVQCTDDEACCLEKEVGGGGEVICGMCLNLSIDITLVIPQLKLFDL